MHFQKNIFDFQKYFFDRKKKVDKNSSHYIDVKFYEEFIFRILKAVWAVWSTQIWLWS